MLLAAALLSGVSLADEVTWFERTISTSASGATSVFGIDLDGDGDLDSLSASFDDDTIAWYENNGDSTCWTRHVITTLAIGAWSVFAIDLDDDGDVDALSASYSDGTIAWYENTGNAMSWVRHVITSSVNGATSVFAADLDGDGDVDVVSTSEYAPSGDTVTWYENVNSGDSATWVVHGIADNEASGGAPYSMLAIDINNDGHIDVITGSAYNINWYENNGNSTAWTAHVIARDDTNGLVFNDFHVFVIDLDADGELDVLGGARASNTIAWYKNNGDATFGTSHVITAVADGVWSVFGADLDGDGDVDVLSASENDNAIAWYENSGNAMSWTRRVITSTASGAYCVFGIDVNGDGRVDALSASRWDSTIAWYENLPPSSAPTTQTASCDSGDESTLVPTARTPTLAPSTLLCASSNVLVEATCASFNGLCYSSSAGCAEAGGEFEPTYCGSGACGCCFNLPTRAPSAAPSDDDSMMMWVIIIAAVIVLLVVIICAVVAAFKLGHEAAKKKDSASLAANDRDLAVPIQLTPTNAQVTRTPPGPAPAQSL